MSRGQMVKVAKRPVTAKSIWDIIRPIDENTINNINLKPTNLQQLDRCMRSVKGMSTKQMLNSTTTLKPSPFATPRKTVPTADSVLRGDTDS